jgi:[ribosomal protein S5]-alanine N-acetyltransferase
MPTPPGSAPTHPSRTPTRVYLRPPRASDREAFLAAVAASRQLHRGWVLPPATAAGFAAYRARYAGPHSRNPAQATHAGFLLCRADDDALVGVYNLSEIVRGSFHSAYLGYYALAPHTAAGYMSEGLALLLAVAYRDLRLHRVEANIQPSNTPSIALVRRAGFTREGYSRRYVKIAGRWRDHERWAMLAEDWRARKRLSR